MLRAYLLENRWLFESGGDEPHSMRIQLAKVRQAIEQRPSEPV